MSERGSSLHFWRPSRDRVRQLLAELGIAGRIVAGNEDWLCLVLFDPTDEPRTLSHAKAPVLKWSYYEDYGLNLELFSQGQDAGKASFVWGSAMTGQPPSASVQPEFASKLIELGIQSSNVDGLLELTRDVESGKAGDTIARDRAARLLGLAAYEWLAPEVCLDVPIETFQKQFPTAEDVVD